MLNFSPRRVATNQVKSVKFELGDKVVVTKASNASLNLYMKTKQAGMVYVHCPCNAKSTTTLEIAKAFSTGFILQGPGFLTVAHPNDLRKV